MHMQYLVFLCFVLFQVVCSEPDKCFKPKVEATDPKWLEEAGKKGWFVPLQKKINPGPSTDISRIEPKLETKKYKHERCSIATLKSAAGPLQLNQTCRYDDILKQNCELETKGTAVDNFFKYFGDFYFVKTDNSSYVVKTMCLFEREPSWMVLSTKPKLSPANLESALKKIEELGFKRDGRAQEGDPILFQGIQVVECGASPTSLLAVPDTDAYTKQITALVPQ